MASHMEREIREQPRVLQLLLEAEGKKVEQITDAVREFNPCFVLMVARGSSDNAALYGKYLFGAINRMPVALAAPSLYTLYKSPPDISRALVIAISQSGQSPDLLEVVESGREQGALTVGITNNPDSPMAALCQWVFPLHAGVERSVAATKSYTAQLMALAMLSATLDGRKALIEELAAIPDQVSLALGVNGQARDVAEWCRDATRCVVIGRGFDFATVHEIALKLKELAAIAAQPYSSADFMHGPLAMVGPGFPVLLVAPEGVAFPEMSRLASRLKRLGSEVIAITDQQQLMRAVTMAIPLRCNVREWLHPLVTVVPGQLLAYHLTLAKGLDPDHPRRLSKVTKTR